MLIIRKEQIKLLDEEMLRRFEDEMVVHLSEFSPPLFRVLGHDQLCDVVRFGFSKAGAYGFSLRGPIRLYLELMLLFGSHFDMDPQYPWAAKILNDERSVSEMQRAEWLHEMTLAYQASVSGAQGLHTNEALSQLLVTGRNPVTFSAEAFDESMKSEMHRVFPQKAAFIGEAALSALIHGGREEAKGYGFPARGEMLMVVLKFAFGHGCGNDQLYPWIGRTLRDERMVSSTAKADRLERKAMTWLEHVISARLKEPK